MDEFIEALILLNQLEIDHSITVTETEIVVEIN